MIRYTKDILAQLSDAGYSQNRIRREKLIGQATLTQLRHGDLVSWKTIDTICKLLVCQPGDLLEYVPDTHPAGISIPAGPAQEPPKIPTSI